MKVLIELNFHVFIPPHVESHPETKKTYSRGQVIDASDIPDGQSAEDWISKGLATAADAA